MSKQYIYFISFETKGIYNINIIKSDIELKNTDGTLYNGYDIIIESVPDCPEYDYTISKVLDLQEMKSINDDTIEYLFRDHYYCYYVTCEDEKNIRYTLSLDPDGKITSSIIKEVPKQTKELLMKVMDELNESKQVIDIHELSRKVITNDMNPYKYNLLLGKILNIDFKLVNNGHLEYYFFLDNGKIDNIVFNNKTHSLDSKNDDSFEESLKIIGSDDLCFINKVITNIININNDIRKENYLLLLDKEINKPSFSEHNFLTSAIRVLLIQMHVYLRRPLNKENLNIINKLLVQIAAVCLVNSHSISSLAFLA